MTEFQDFIEQKLKEQYEASFGISQAWRTGAQGLLSDTGRGRKLNRLFMLSRCWKTSIKALVVDKEHQKKVCEPVLAELEEKAEKGSQYHLVH